MSARREQSATEMHAARSAGDDARRLFQQSEDRFQALVEATGQLVWSTPPDGLVVDIPFWRAYTGQTVEEVRGWGWLDAVHPEDRVRVRRRWARAVATRTLYEVEYRLRRHDGVYRDFLVRAVPVLEPSPDGTLREWVGVHTDITARKRADEAIRRSAKEAAERAAELEATFDAMADGILYCDAEGRLVRANSRAYELIDRYSRIPEQQLPVGERALTLFDRRGRTLAREQWPIARVLRGETLTADRAVDVLVRGHDGDEILLSLTGAPVRDGAGAIAGAVLGIRDVTERRRAEERTRVVLDALLTMAETLVVGSDLPLAMAPAGSPNPAAQRLAILTQQVIGCRRLGISAVEPETEYLRPIAVVGIPPEQEAEWWKTEGRGGPLRQQIQPDLLARLEAGELVVIDMREPPYNELPNPYGVTVIVTAPMRVAERLVGMLALDYAGAEHRYTEDELALIGAVARLGALVIERERLLREREESRASELALRETTRRFDEFLSIASHELRTPLTSIRANTQLALRRMPPDTAGNERNGSKLASARTLVARAERQTTVLSRLVDDLLDVSRIQANKLEFHCVPCELSAVVSDAVQEQRLAWPSRPIPLEMPEGGVRIIADPDRISQVVTNFLTNALKYSEESAPVVVRLDVADGLARVSVRDQGPGLPLEEQSRIWERFYRAPGVPVLAGAGVGLGLGLHISKTIVERHGGQVGVESAPGSGSTFWFTIPLAADE